MNARTLAQLSLTLTLLAIIIVAILLLSGNTSALVLMGIVYLVTFVAAGLYLLWKRRTRRDDV
jgi:Ca2+/Na+ antiporter